MSAFIDVNCSKCGLILKEASRKLESNDHWMMKHENGEKLIPFSILRKAALVFDVSLSTFFEGV
jgi:hypothetical protein